MAARKKPGTALEKPRVLTPEVCAKILEVLADGNYLVTALRCVGVTRQTFAYWQNLYRAGDPKVPAPVCDFFDSIETAMAIAEVRAVHDIRHNPQTHQGNRFFLERRFPQRWAKPSERPVQTDTSDRRSVVEEAQRLADEIRAEREAEGGEERAGEAGDGGEA